MASEAKTFFRYLPASPRDEAWGLVVTNAGVESIEPGMDYPPSGHPNNYTFSWDKGRILNEFQLHFIPRGSGTFESESGGKGTIASGDFFLLFPGVKHRYKPLNKTGWDEYWVGFEGDLGKKLLAQKVFSPQRPILRAGMEQRAMELFSEMLILLRNEPPGFMPVLSSITTLLLSHLYSATLTEFVDSRTEKIVRHAKNQLRKTLGDPMDFENLSRELGVSYSWLRRSFRQVTGLAPYQYRLKLRIAYTMDLLANSNYSVKEVAIIAGFEDEHYFSRLFKKKTGVSPKVWKQTHEVSH